MTDRTMKDAVDVEEFERWKKRLPPRNKEVLKIEEPKPPTVAGMITLDKIKLENILALPKGRNKIVRNSEGVMFTGFDVTIQMQDGKKISGWMPSKDFHDMRRILFQGKKVLMTNVEF